ncbi:Ribonuclease VapC25 [Castellaniella caeni]
MTPDVNVLVAASRSDHPHHAKAYRWLEQALLQVGQGDTFSVQPMVLASFLRLVTHAKIFCQPTPMSEAVRFTDALLRVPGVALATLGAEWPTLRCLCLERQLADNDVPDAWLAAAVIEQGEHLASFDADFKRLLPQAQLTHLQA